MGLADVGGHKGEYLLLEQADVPLPVPGGDAVFQPRHQLPQLIPPAGGHGVRHPGQIAQQVPLQMGGGGEIAVAFQKAQDIPLHPGGLRPGVSAPEHGKQGPAETGPCFQLRAQELEKLALVHLQHLHGHGHFLGNPLAHAGGNHRPLPRQQPCQDPCALLALAQLLDEGLEIGVVPDLPALAGVLLFGAVVRAGDTVWVDDVLDRAAVRRDLGPPVDRCVCIVVTRHRVGYIHDFRHFSHP